MGIPDLGLGRIGQIAIVVRDIKASMEHYWSTLGIGPWKVYTNASPPLQGRAGGGDARVALPDRQARSRGSGVPASRAASAAQTDRNASRGRDYCLLAWLLLEAPAVQPGRNE